MDNLLRHLASRSAEPFDCIVHVGAGADADSEDYSALNPKHIVLLEADPEAHSALAERFADAPDVNVLQTLVAPEKGDTTFHRFTLPSFNAPLGLGRLRELYPRIDWVEELRMQGQTLHDIVPQSVLGARNLLIFDIPGQETAVLRALPLEFLERFTSMVALAGAESWQEGAETLAATLTTLKDKNFELAREASEDPAWPCVALVRDAAKVAMQQELEKRAELLVDKATQIHQQTEQINALTAERDALAARVSSLGSEHADLAARHSSLATALEQLQGQHSPLVTERDALTTAMQGLEGRLQNLGAENESLHAGLAQAQAEAENERVKNTSLSAAFGEIEEQHAALVVSGNAAADEIVALRRRVEELAQLGRQERNEIDELLRTKENLIMERDSLIANVSTLEDRLVKLQSNARVIEEEFTKAEGQIDLIKEIFLREAIR